MSESKEVKGDSHGGPRRLERVAEHWNMEMARGLVSYAMDKVRGASSKTEFRPLTPTSPGEHFQERPCGSQAFSKATFTVCFAHAFAVGHERGQ